MEPRGDESDCRKSYKLEDKEVGKKEDGTKDKLIRPVMHCKMYSAKSSLSLAF